MPAKKKAAPKKRKPATTAKKAPKLRRTLPDDVECLEKALAELAHEVSGMKDGHHFERNAVRQIIKRLQARVDELELKLPHVCLLASRLEKLEQLATAMGPLWTSQGGHTRPITLLSTEHLQNIHDNGYGSSNFRDDVRRELRRRDIDAQWRAVQATAESFNEHLPDVKMSPTPIYPADYDTAEVHRVWIGGKLVYGTPEYLRAAKEEAAIEEEVDAFVAQCRHDRLRKERVERLAREEHKRKHPGLRRRIAAAWRAFINPEGR